MSKPRIYRRITRPLQGGGYSYKLVDDCEAGFEDYGNLDRTLGALSGVLVGFSLTLLAMAFLDIL